MDQGSANGGHAVAFGISGAFYHKKIQKFYNQHKFSYFYFYSHHDLFQERKIIHFIKYFCIPFFTKLNPLEPKHFF